MKQLDLPDRIIRKYVTYLHKSLPHIPTAISEPYDLPETYAKEVADSGYSNQSIQNIADHIGFYLGLPHGIKVTLITPNPTRPVWASNQSGQATLTEADALLDYSGLYQTKGKDHSEILLVNRKVYVLKHLLAILAHEYSHHYLHRHKVTLNDTKRDEYLTDIATAYLGLGFYVLEGYIPITWTTDHWDYGSAYGHTTHNTSVGYLTSETIGSAILMSTPLRQWNPRDIVRRFPSWPFRLEAYIRLWPYRRKYRGK